MEGAVNILAPWFVFSGLREPLGDVRALMAASLPPLVWSVMEFLRRRRIDALSLLVLGGITLSLLAFLGGGGVRALQLREQLVIGAIGLVFLASVVMGRPLMLELARARLGRSGASGELEGLAHQPILNRAMKIMTLVWGFAMAAEAMGVGALAVVLPIRLYLVASPVIGYGALTVLTFWTYRYAARKMALARAAGDPGSATGSLS